MEKVNKVVIEWAEGYNEYCEQFPKTFNSLNEVNDFFSNNVENYPSDGGYDKHKIQVAWTDGETYDYRADLQKPDSLQSQLELNVGMRVLEGLNMRLSRASEEQKEEINKFISTRLFM